jgi:hypothetical protein
MYPVDSQSIADAMLSPACFREKRTSYTDHNGYYIAVGLDFIPE